MRTETITRTVYTVRELQEHHPAAFARALETHNQRECEWDDRSDDLASLSAIDKAVGYSRGYANYGADGLGDAAEFTGRRAWAWLENRLLADVRIPWSPMWSHPLDWRRKASQKRREFSRHGMYYRPGRVEPCPFTGYYMDEVLLDDLRESLRSGMTVGDAMLGLAATMSRVCDEELDSRTTEDYFIERSEDLEVEFLSNGTAL